MSDTDIKQKEEIPSHRWVQTLSGKWGVQTYGAVEFLRVHSVVRSVVAALGVMACVLAVAEFGGLHIPGFTIPVWYLAVLFSWCSARYIYGVAFNSSWLRSKYGFSIFSSLALEDTRSLPTLL